MVGTGRKSGGNIVVILALILTGLFAVGGFAIESTLYLLKRQKVQTLAESVAMAAALSFPERELVEDAAQRWYDVLRVQGGKEIAPDRNLSPDILQISFGDNKTQANNTIAYALTNITVRITLEHRPRIFPVLRSAKSLVRIVGQAQAGLSPTDIILVVENTASFVEPGSVQLRSLLNRFGHTKGGHYSAQCFSPAGVALKRALIRLYDTLSQVGTFRVGVITTTSRTGEPFILAPLGETSIPGSGLEYDGDQPDFHSTRCAAAQAPFLVPENSNLNGNIWSPALDLTRQLRNFSSGNFAISPTEKILVRDALWLQESGYATSTGFIHPRYFFSDPLPALKIASSMLKDSRRQDTFPVRHRYILLLTDDAGVTPPEWSSPLQGTNIHSKDKNICKRWATEKSSSEVKLGVLYFGHNRELPGHNYEPGQANGKEVHEMRTDCLLRGGSQARIFFSETSPYVGLAADDFADRSVPLVAFALKQAELFR